jgi:hypothetical protein
MSSDTLEPDYFDNLLEWCVSQATLAPSTHNTQPWHFRVRGECIELIADRSRALPVSDPDDRELTISCGAALFTLRVAAAARGFATFVETLPVADDPDLLARVTPVTGYFHHIADTSALAQAVKQRRTYRRPFVAEAIPEFKVRSLVDSAAMEGAALVVMAHAEQRRGLVDLVERADQLLWADVHWRRELGTWMHPRRRGEGFGIPGLAHAAAQLVVRSFDVGRGIPAHGAEVIEGSPLLAVLCSPSDTAADWLASGQALQRTLLRACADGLQASYLNQPLHLPEFREEVARLVPGAGVPQLVLRLGTPADELAPVVRRPLPQVVDFDWMAR